MIIFDKYYPFFLLVIINSDTKIIIVDGNVLFNDALNTFYLRLYGIRHTIKDHSVRDETRCCHMATLSD